MYPVLSGSCGNTSTVSVVPDANFPLLYCEKGLLDFDLTSAETSDEKAEIQIVELKGGRSRNIVPDEASCLLKCEDPEKTAENLELPEQVTVEIADGFLKLSVRGISTHCMSPEKGFNAVPVFWKHWDSSGKNFPMLLI